jgi:hypothetical protein
MISSKFDCSHYVKADAMVKFNEMCADPKNPKKECTIELASSNFVNFDSVFGITGNPRCLTNITGGEPRIYV